MKGTKRWNIECEWRWLCHNAGRLMLNTLKLGEVSVRDTIQKWIAIIEMTRYKSSCKSFSAIQIKVTVNTSQIPDMVKASVDFPITHVACWMVFLNVRFSSCNLSVCLCCFAILCWIPLPLCPHSFAPTLFTISQSPAVVCLWKVLHWWSLYPCPFVSFSTFLEGTEALHLLQCVCSRLVCSQCRRWASPTFWWSCYCWTSSPLSSIFFQWINLHAQVGFFFLSNLYPYWWRTTAVCCCLPCVPAYWQIACQGF